MVLVKSQSESSQKHTVVSTECDEPKREAADPRAARLRRCCVTRAICECTNPCCHGNLWRHQG